MQRLIIDTNVIVSALISRNGVPAKIIDEIILENKVQVYLSNDIYEEYVTVIHRDKFSKIKDFTKNAILVLNYLNQSADYYEPNNEIALIKDADDNKFLESAFEAPADFIITGNTNDFVIKEFHNTKIVTPSEYWNFHKPK